MILFKEIQWVQIISVSQNVWYGCKNLEKCLERNRFFSVMYKSYTGWLVTKKKPVNLERRETTAEIWWRLMLLENLGRLSVQFPDTPRQIFFKMYDNLTTKIHELFSNTRKTERKTKVVGK